MLPNENILSPTVDGIYKSRKKKKKLGIVRLINLCLLVI
jgi:hypothetical protein